MASVGDIPELVKAMYTLFGEKWGKWIGRAIVISILCAVAGAAIAAIMAGIEGITSWASSLSPEISNILLVTVSTFIAFGIIVGIAVALGIVVGIIMRIGFATPMHRNINSLLRQTEALLLDAKQSGPQNTQYFEKLLADLERIKEEWNTSRITRFIRFILGRKAKNNVDV